MHVWISDSILNKILFKTFLFIKKFSFILWFYGKLLAYKNAQKLGHQAHCANDY